MILKLIPKSEIAIILPLLQLLDPDIPLDVLTSRLQDMVSQSYECLGVYIDDKLVACSGIWIMTRYYSGRSVEPDHFFIKPEFRGRGIATAMMDWIVNYGLEHNCVSSELNCYVKNENGLAFWDSKKYERKGIHFLKSIQ